MERIARLRDTSAGRGAGSGPIKVLYLARVSTKMADDVPWVTELGKYLPVPGTYSIMEMRIVCLVARRSA